MKNIYFSIAVLFFCFTSCKKTEETNVENSNDTISVQKDSVVEVKDTVSFDSTATEASASSDSTESSDGKLPNKMSTSTSVSYSDPSKGKYPLAETKWRLVELNGNKVDPTTRRDYYMNFDSKSGTFKSFVGCNRITGTYFMKATTKLAFSKVSATKKGCDNIKFENDFINTIQKTDNYMIEGNMLHLHSGKKAIAKLEAIK
ncbi:META domain-containing protein [Flavobacterium sp.]|uniref:META domain-containing protein n=1 Tax=Flavobacterium sp. TaxID=239 RepID=UPI00260023EF|nr:META domain-containing protein [Flavobacterium sp.]